MVVQPFKPSCCVNTESIVVESICDAGSVMVEMVSIGLRRELDDVGLVRAAPLGHPVKGTEQLESQFSGSKK